MNMQPNTATMKNAGNTVKSIAKHTAHSLITWEWTKKFLHWLIISAGTVSECAFLIASLWMSLNSSVHPLVRLAMSEDTAVHISEFATAAYVALPEMILGLAFVVTIGHIRLWLYDKKNYSAVIWSVLYGLPTLVFLTLSLFTLGSSVTSTRFIMPEYLIVVRALAGYMFAFTSLLYTQLGKPQEVDRLVKKDVFIAELKEENAATLATLQQEKDAMIADLEKENARLKDDLSQVKQLLTESKNTQTELLKAVNKSSEDALQAYSAECINWLKSGIKTVSSEEITRYTGHSKRKIDGAITKGYLQLAPRNKELILVSSLVEWLKNTPPPAVKIEQETGPILHVVNG